MAKRRKTTKKHTITPEQLAKMQEGRRKAKIHRERMAELYEKGLDKTMPMTKTERMLNEVRRK